MAPGANHQLIMSVLINMKVFIVIDSSEAVATVAGLYTCATDAHIHWKRLPAASIWQGLLNSEEIERVETDIEHWTQPLVRQNAVRD